MGKARTLFNDGCRVFSLMLLMGFVVFCGIAQAQILTEKPLNQIRPEIKAKLETLQNEVADKGYTFTVGYSPVMEYTIPQLCGLVEPKNWRQRAVFEEMEPFLTTVATPSSWDWRTLPGGNTPVRNQGSCGSCWAFGTVAPLEILISYNCGKVVDLSEQYLVSCNSDGWGCNGGWFAHDYHEWKYSSAKGETDWGAVLETNFSYQHADVACNGPHTHPYKISDWKYINGYTVPSVAAIKAAIQSYGPVSVAVCVGSAFQAYKSGIFDANESCGSATVNHAVALVGWVDDSPTDPNNGYWILKNSWGNWGEQGYMRIRYGTSMVGYAANYINFTSANCAVAPASLDCTSATPLSLGVVKSDTTAVGGQSKVSTYGCSGRTESGPEKVYQVTTTSSGSLTATLSGLGSNDLDVFILSACNTNSCVAFGDTTATYANAAPGTYYIVVDGNNGAAGAFNLLVNVASPLPDLTGSWTQLTPYSRGRTVYGTLQVNNIGNANAGSFGVGYYLSNDGKTAGQLLGTQTVSSLKAGASVYLYPRLSFSSSVSGKYIIAKVDYTVKVTESNKANNVVAGKVSLTRAR